MRVDDAITLYCIVHDIVLFFESSEHEFGLILSVVTLGMCDLSSQQSYADFSPLSPCLEGVVGNEISIDAL